MNNKEIKISKSSFELNKLITTSQMFSKIELMMSSRLVLRCIIDFWNLNLGCAYPTQKTIAKCTGLSEVSVGQAIKELELKQLIKKELKNKRLYYRFTISFFVYLDLIPKVTLGDTISSFGNIPQAALDNNILINKENTSFLNSDEDLVLNEKERLEITIKTFENNPVFKKCVLELREKLRKLAEK